MIERMLPGLRLTVLLLACCRVMGIVIYCCEKHALFCDVLLCIVSFRTATPVLNEDLLYWSFLLDYQF